MKTDLVLAPFDASVAELIEAAQAADAGGFDAVWTYDHYSGLVTGRNWSRDPFVALGAIGATTERINVGVLVANANNRHPAQLACAVNSLQSVAPGRVLLGLGAGASPASRWSSEQAAIGQPAAGAATRRALLIETIQAVRAIWAGEQFDGHHVCAAASMAVVDGAPIPPIIIGSSSTGTTEVACGYADGVNLLPGDDLAERIEFTRSRTSMPSHTSWPFEISVFKALDVDHPLGGDPTQFTDLGVDRRTLYVTAPYPIDRIAAIARALAGST